MNSTVIFDLDGTLIDSSRDLASAINWMRKQFECKALDVSTVCGFIGNGVDKLVERSIRDSGIPFDEAKKLMVQNYSENVCVHTVLFDGVKSGLEKLKSNGFELAVVTN